MKINGRIIGPEMAPYIIAEMSANHNGKIENAFKIMNEAKKAGVDAIKIQTYRPETMTLNSENEDFQIRGGLWDGWNLFKLYEVAQTPWEWHKSLFDYAKKINITIFSTPFDASAVDFLEELDAPAYKIASFEIVDLKLIKYAASTGKPLIISTGMADIEEISEAIQAARDGGCRNIALLHCVSGYPAPLEDYNLKTIKDMRERFGVNVGLSDHSLDNVVAIASVALGACIIEKHFTLDRSGGGPDDSFSIEPEELANLCKSAKNTWATLGEVDYSRKSSEKGNIKFRRSLYFVNDLEKNQVIGPDDIRCIRPGYGLKPNEESKIIGLKVNKAIAKNNPVRRDDIIWDSLI